MAGRAPHAVRFAATDKPAASSQARATEDNSRAVLLAWRAQRRRAEAAHRTPPLAFFAPPVSQRANDSLREQSVDNVLPVVGPSHRQRMAEKRIARSNATAAAIAADFERRTESSLASYVRRAARCADEERAAFRLRSGDDATAAATPPPLVPRRLTAGVHFSTASRPAFFVAAVAPEAPLSVRRKFNSLTPRNVRQREATALAALELEMLGASADAGALVVHSNALRPAGASPHATQGADRRMSRRKSQAKVAPLTAAAAHGGSRALPALTALLQISDVMCGPDIGFRNGFGNAASYWDRVAAYNKYVAADRERRY